MGDEELYERLEPPKTIVVRFGSLKLVAEYSYDGKAKPGCGTKLVARTLSCSIATGYGTRPRPQSR